MTPVRPYDWVRAEKRNLLYQRSLWRPDECLWPLERKTTPKVLHDLPKQQGQRNRLCYVTANQHLKDLQMSLVLGIPLLKKYLRTELREGVPLTPVCGQIHSPNKEGWNNQINILSETELGSNKRTLLVRDGGLGNRVWWWRKIRLHRTLWYQDDEMNNTWSCRIRCVSRQTETVKNRGQ